MMADDMATLDNINNFESQQTQQPMATLQNILSQQQPTQPTPQVSQAQPNSLNIQLRNLMFNNPASKVLGISDYAAGLSSGMGNLLNNADKVRQYLQNSVYSKIFGQNLPQEEPLSSALKNVSGVDLNKQGPTSPGLKGEIPYLAGQVTPYLLGGELNLPAILGGKLMGQIIPQATIGAITSEKPEEGAIEAARGAAIGGAPGLVARTVSKYAETVNPLKFTQETMDKLKDVYQANKTEASKNYNAVKDKYGSSDVTAVPENYLNYDQTTLDAIKKYAKPEYNAFLEKPTYGNLHALQSKVYSEGGALRKNTATRAEGSTLLEARQDMVNKIKSFLEKDPDALSQYQKGTDITRTLVKPQEIRKYIEKLSQSKNPYLKPEPEKLLSELNETLGHKYMPEDIAQSHPMKELRDQLQKKLGKGQLAKGLTDVGAGTLIGSLLGHPLYGALGALLGGPKLFEKLPALTKVAQNPQIEALAEALMPTYSLARKGLSGLYGVKGGESNRKNKS